MIDYKMVAESADMIIIKNNYREMFLKWSEYSREGFYESE